MSKILHLTTVHEPFDQRIFHRECVSLAKVGFDVALLAYGEIGDERESVKLVSLGQNNRHSAGLHFMNRWKRTRCALKRAIDFNAKLYHFHDPELIVAGLEIKKQTKARVIYDCHEDNVSYMLQKKYIPTPIRGLLAAAIRHQELKASKMLDAIVTADEEMRRYFLQKGANRVVRVDNFPRLDLFLEQENDILPKYDIVYHGSIPKYHLETCFAVDTELVKRGLELKWLFIGKYSDLDWAKDEIKKKKAENRITLKGVVQHESISRWVRLGRIGIIPLPNYPKFKRNVPTKLFEFMALNMPVVLSDLPPSRPFVGDGKCAIMVNPDSPAEYADAISYLITHPNRCTEMGQEGRRRVVSNYNWEIAFSKLLNLYQELLCTK
jgi:glycosyltransferase involved in cell wall biosynthesis